MSRSHDRKWSLHKAQRRIKRLVCRSNNPCRVIKIGLNLGIIAYSIPSTLDGRWWMQDAMLLGIWSTTDKMSQTCGVMRNRRSHLHGLYFTDFYGIWRLSWLISLIVFGQLCIYRLKAWYSMKDRSWITVFHLSLNGLWNSCLHHRAGAWYSPVKIIARQVLTGWQTKQSNIEISLICRLYLYIPIAVTAQYIPRVLFGILEGFTGKKINKRHATKLISYRRAELINAN